ERVLRQIEAIETLRPHLLDFTLLAGIEVDILGDGSLDLDDEVLEQLDLVVASVHSRFQQDMATMTSRIIAALENPHVDILGHATGRRLGHRDPYQIDVEAVLDAAVRTRTVVEINASPERLDLPDVDVRRGKDKGLRFAVNSDAHSVAGLDVLHFGVMTARRGWLEAADVVNTKPAGDVAAFFARPKAERW
ncbi:MAG: PHP domain-containing protein, partial [Thermaerobacterales bacterium]